MENNTLVLCYHICHPKPNSFSNESSCLQKVQESTQTFIGTSKTHKLLTKQGELFF